MTFSFRKRRWLRAAIGVVSAYVLAVQMMLAGIVATEMAVAAPALDVVICYGADGSPAAHPDGSPKAHLHQSCAICAYAGLSAPMPEQAVASFVEPAQSTFAPSLSRTAIHAAFGHNPRTSQGPPQTA